MIRKKIWILLALICYSISSLSYCSLAFADSGGGGASFDPDNYTVEGDLESLADDLQEAIDSGKIDPTFDTAQFLGALGSTMAALSGAANPLVFGAVSSAIGAVAGDMLADMNSVKDQNGNFGYSIGADAAQSMYDAAVKAIADNSTYSAWPVVLPRGYVILDTTNMTYDAGSPQIGDYPVMYGSGRDNSWPVNWYFNSWLVDTSYVWCQHVTLSNPQWLNGVYSLYAYSADGTQDKGSILYPTDGATINNWLYTGAYVPLITGNSFIAFTTQSDCFNPAARLETMIRNPWLDNKIITHDTIMNTNWEEVNTTNYTILQQGVNDGMDVSALLAALNAQTDVMSDLLLQVNETLDTLQELLQYAILIYDKLDKWFPDYNEADLPPVSDINSLAEDYSVPDKDFSSDFWDEIWDNSYIWILVAPLFVAITGYALFGRG